MKERELVATGASVAAGCVPCTQYHLKAVRDAGATQDEVTRAIDGALAVKHASEAVMRRVAVDALGTPRGDVRACGGDEAVSSTPGDRIAALVAIAAAVAVNCGTSFRRHVENGRAVGVRDDEIQLAVTFARMIRAKAAHTIDEATSEHPTAGVAPPASCCGGAASV